ncbi:MAG: hypothetical protein Q8O67_28170 [Deltaproteobacteria bacterium]|nr:hypothetical protein [Deltaproteobacteria bacterium]
MTDTPTVDKPSIVPSLVREIPPQERSAPVSDAPDDVVPPSARPAEQLGFQMRFEAGRALLALDNREGDAGVVVRRALFEVPDVAFPLDVSGGALRFQNKRLTLRAVELAISWDALFVVEALRRAGLTLLRERSRAGGLELLVEVLGPSGPVPVRARCVFAPVGEGGVALVLHEVIGFGQLPRPRLELAPALLDALAFPGGLPARAMVRRAEPFRAVFSRLLPAYGWKVPALGDVRVHEAVLGKGEVVLRAWSGKPPDGWKAPKELKRGPLEEAIALAIFADGLVAAGGTDGAQLKLIDRLVDEKALAVAAIPFAAEILRSDPRRRADGDDLVDKALIANDEHLGLLAAWADAAEIDPTQRAHRLLRLGAVADADDEPWVAARAALAAAWLARDANDLPLAVKAAEAAVEADPSVAEAGILLSRLLQKTGDKARALVVGRAALDRAGAGSIVEPQAFLEAADNFAIELASVAREVEGIDGARVLLRRALRTREVPEALVPLVELEIDAGHFERAAEGLTRLLVIAASTPSLQKDVELLAARLAESKGDKEAARGHLVRARALDKDDARVALRLARLHDDAKEIDQALATLQDVISDAADAVDLEAVDVKACMFFAARLLVQRARAQNRKPDAERARALLARLPAEPVQQGGVSVARVDAEARALLDDTAPLARLLLEDAAAAVESRVGTGLRTEAARLFLAANQLDDAADAIAAAFVRDPAAAGDLLVENAAVSDLAARVGHALKTVAADVADVHSLARRLAATGRPRDGFALLKEQDDRSSRELRATFSKDAGDVDAEIAERSALIELVDGAAGQVAQRLRLAVLFERAGRSADAADAWAATGDDADVTAWLRSAVATADGERLAKVLVRDDVDLSAVESKLLRVTIDHVEDATAKRRLLAALASRNDDVADVERWLQAARALPKDEAALAFVDAARRSNRVDWLLDGTAQLKEIGVPRQALSCLNEVIAAGGPLATDRSVVERALDLAIDLDDDVTLEARVTELLARDDLDADARRALHLRRVDAHGAHRASLARGAAEERAIGAWLDERPTDVEALSRLITLVTAPIRDAADLESAVVRLDAARAKGLGEEAQDLVVVVADAARDRGAACEARARELLLGFSLEPALRERVQRRLVDLSVRDGNASRAVALLHNLVDQAIDQAAESGVIAALWLRIADLEEEEQKDGRAAAQALEQMLIHAPEDATASRRLLALLLEHHDDEALARECLRRARYLPESAERTDLLLRAGQVARAHGRLDEARRTWLRALSSTPFSKDALDRLLDLAKETQSRRLAIRARLAAARVLEKDSPADATRQAAEAGGLLAGVLRRVRLAVVAFSFGERIAVERGIDDDGAQSRMLVELFRALGDGKNARLRLDRLVDRATGRDRARLLEARADVEANLQGDIEAAIADRRAALSVDPAFSASARALVRLLRDQGNVRSAVDVERSHADAASAGEARGLTYARLTAVADDELKDPALVDELAVVALGLREDVEVRRRQVVAREAISAAASDSERAPHTLKTVEALLGLLARPGLAAEEVLARALRAATLQAQLGDQPAAAKTLQQAVDNADVAALSPADVPRDRAHAELAELLASTGRPRDAANLVLKVIAASPEGTPAFGSRTKALERAAAWLDDAPAPANTGVDGLDIDPESDDSPRLALDTLMDAAAAGALSDDGEARRARLAEELGRHDVAVTALDSLVSRNIEVTETARRLAEAAERAGDNAKALSSWQLRLQHAPDDEQAWAAVERLATALGDVPAMRAAIEQLVKRGVGTVEERSARAVVVARDARDRENDPASALRWFEEARALASTPRIRSDSYSLAKDVDDAVALAVLDDMHEQGDVLASDERRHRASLRLRRSAALDDTAAKADVAAALGDVVAVLDAGVEGVDDLLALIAARDPRALLQAALDRPVHETLRNALVDLNDPRIDDDGIFALVLARPDDVAVVRAAALRERQQGRAGAAADRLLALSSRLADKGPAPTDGEGLGRDLVDEAAGLATDDGGAAVLERLETLRPAFRRKPALRDAGLTALRDIEAWPAVATVLEDAVVVEDRAAERRALRLQLVSVLRTGVESTEAEERAAVHLQQLVDEDPVDREAWGELFECLDRLKDTDRLQRALGVRAETAEGIERRELVRRRVELLLTLNRGTEGAATLQAVRAVNDDDALKQLERRLHLATDGDAFGALAGRAGGPAFAAFLDAELARTPVADDARSLLGLSGDVVPAGARVRAHLVLLKAEGAIPALIEPMLFSSQNLETRIAEAAAVVAEGPADLSVALVQGLALAAPRLGSTDALALGDALFTVDANDVVTQAVASAFGAASAARRWRTRGPRALDVDAARLPERQRAAVLFRRAARLADRAALRAAAAPLGLQDVVVDVAGHVAAMSAQAQTAIVAQAFGAAGTLALLRHGDPRGLARVEASPSSTIARRARTTPLTHKRLAARLHLAGLLGDDLLTAAELRSAADVADAAGLTALVVRALDALFALRTPQPSELVRRADAAWALGDVDAAAWCDRAADAAPAEAIRLRRRAIEGFLRHGEKVGLGRSLLALARSAPPGRDGDDVRNEALSTAEAARLTDVADAIMAEAADQVVDVDERATALRRRAELRLHARDPQGAFNVLTDGARRLAGHAAANALRNDAYDVAAGNALVDAMLEVVDDDLARAGLLAALGKRSQAQSLASTLEGPAALWLVADCALADADVAAEEQALQKLADAGFAQDAVLVRLIDAARRRGDVDDAVTRSLALARSAPTAQRLKLVVDCLVDARVSADQRARGVQALLAFDGLSAADAAFVAAAAVDVAASTPDLGLRRSSRNALAKLQDTDTGWAHALAVDLDEADTSDVALALRPLLSRRGVITQLVASSSSLTRSRALGEALRVLIRGGDAAAVIEAVPPSGQPWPVKDALAAALEVLGKSRDAADLLAQSIDADSAAEAFPARAFRLKASELYVDAGAPGAAARLLLGVQKDDLDDAVLLHARNVVDRSAREGAMGDAARLAEHVARIGGDDKFVLRALACADAAGGDTALHVAGWRLRAGDTRALPLLAHHALEGSATQGYFAAWHALRIGVRSFADNAPADFQRIAALKTQEGPTSPSSSSGSALSRARINKLPARQAAWRQLSADVAASDDIGAARLLVRAGVPMSDAPLEVRLAADPALGDLTARAAAIAEGLASVKPERRAAVVVAFDVCSARGCTTAQQRRAVATILPRTLTPLDAAIDAAALGEAVDVKALIKGLKRHPSASTRAATAALLVSLGQRELAGMLLPAILATPTLGDDVRVRALREGATDDLEGLGKLRLSQLQGPRLDVEERIAAIAARLGRTDLLAESLLRQASLTSSADERAQLLARRAAALLETNPLAAKLAATAAFAHHKTEAHARLLVACAERIDDPRETNAALEALQEVAVSDDDKQDAALRRARVLARRMLRPEDAVALLADALIAQPSFALFSEKAAIQTELLNDHVGAAMALLAAVDLTNQPPDVRNTLRLKAADLLQRDGSSTSMELAISTLCESFENGHAEGLDDAERLARANPGPGLARVLDLRLRDTDDAAARRVIVLERARLLAELDDKTGAITLLEAQAVADEIDLGARLQLAGWYLGDRRILDAALAFESAARIPGLPAAGCGPPAREAASLLAALGDLERAGPLADMAVAAGVTDLEVLSVAEAWHRSHENWASVDDLLDKELEHVASMGSDHRREAHLWMERAQVRRDHLNDESGAKKALYRVLELVLDHPRALQMMREEAHKADTWGALRMALFRAAETSTDKVQQVSWLREIAGIDADRLTDNKAAQATIDRALAIAPDDADAMVLKASLMVRAGEVDGLPILMERLEKRGVTELPGLLHLTRGDALLVAGERAGASTSFRRATEDPETSARAWDRLIDMADGPAVAIPLLDEARRATLDTRRRVTLTRKEQRLRTKQGDDDGAAAAAEQILQLEPGDADALKMVRESLTKRRKLKELAPYLLGWARAVDAVEQAPERARRLTDVGAFTLDELGQEGPARALFEEALSLQSDQPVALVRLADIAWASRDDERALDLLDRIPADQWTALTDDQGAPRQAAELFFRRARCAYALGNADVRERLRQVMRQDAKHTGALEMLAKIALEQHDDDAAEMALESLSRAIPPREDPVRLSTVLVDLSQLRSRKKKFDEAAAAAERAFELNTSNLVVLETLAKAREEAGKFVDAAEAWRRIAAVKSGGDRRRAMERRALALVTGAKIKEGANAWLELFAESNDVRHQQEAQDLARRSGDADLVKRSGALPIDPAAPVVAAPLILDRIESSRTETMQAGGAGGGALVIQLRANLDENDAVQALSIALAAKAHGPLEEEAIRLAMIAADRANRPDAAVELAEFRLQTATDPKEIMRVALAAGRIARDKLHDDDRAAALLYQAHQADAEDVEVRLELTELYARIPRLSSHAVTGILQLLRRTPADARIFTLAATLSDGQGQIERAQAMRAIESVLRGKSSPQDVVNVGTAPPAASAVQGLDREAIASRMAPTGWNSPLQQLISLMGIHLEVALGGPAAPPGAKPLAQASPKSLALAERVDRLLPGRVVQFLIADVERATVAAAGVPQIILPRELLANETALLAAIARGIGVVRLGAVITEIVWPGQETEILDLFRTALLGQGARDARSDLLISRLREDEKQQARALTLQVLEKPDVAGTLQILTRACDRFALVATGSPIAALAVSALPTLLKEPPQRGMLLLQGSVRALELCAFAARDNAWLLRRQQGLSPT